MVSEKKEIAFPATQQKMVKFYNIYALASLKLMLENQAREKTFEYLNSTLSKVEVLRDREEINDGHRAIRKLAHLTNEDGKNLLLEMNRIYDKENRMEEEAFLKCLFLFRSAYSQMTSLDDSHNVSLVLVNVVELQIFQYSFFSHLR